MQQCYIYIAIRKYIFSDMRLDQVEHEKRNRSSINKDWLHFWDWFACILRVRYNETANELTLDLPCRDFSVMMWAHLINNIAMKLSEDAANVKRWKSWMNKNVLC